MVPSIVFLLVMLYGNILFVHQFLVAVQFKFFQYSIASLESWQYKVVKLVLNTNMNILKSALFFELGWEPINNYIDRHSVSYFDRI